METSAWQKPKGRQPTKAAAGPSTGFRVCGAMWVTVFHCSGCSTETQGKNDSTSLNCWMAQQEERAAPALNSLYDSHPSLSQMLLKMSILVFSFWPVLSGGRGLNSRVASVSPKLHLSGNKCLTKKREKCNNFAIRKESARGLPCTISTTLPHAYVSLPTPVLRMDSHLHVTILQEMEKQPWQCLQ